MNSTITIDSGGIIRFIWRDELIGLAEAGETRIDRASHVEPAGGKWFADLWPVGGPRLGPFKLRGDAIAAEVAWLEERWL